ncbi:MAG: XRE family transcriptional regulator [Bacteroides sp.]|nr:XRE family transcriptional regulator [Bacteroides sp.]
MENLEKIVLINKALGMRGREFSELIQISPPNYSQMKKGKRPAGDAIVNKLCVRLNVSRNWFDNWEGDLSDPMITRIVDYVRNGGAKKPSLMESNATIVTQDVVYIPLVNQYAYAGYLDGYDNITYMDQLPQIPFMVDKEGRGHYIAFEVKGDSMNDGTEDSYLEGDRLYCREIARHLWATSRLHLRKWDFVIVHEDGILVKRILDHDVENHTITIHSLNDMYPDKIIDLKDVRQIFNVIESVRPRRR